MTFTLTLTSKNPMLARTLHGLTAEQALTLAQLLAHQIPDCQPHITIHAELAGETRPTWDLTHSLRWAPGGFTFLRLALADPLAHLYELLTLPEDLT